METSRGALRRALTAHDRELLRRIIDAEQRRRHAAEDDLIEAVKRSYREQIAAR